MFNKVLQDCRKEKLIEKGDCVLAGVSGGADSVCLLLLLCKLREKIKFSLQVVHVEHGIRGAESEADALFVKNLCDKLKLQLHLYHVDAPGFAKEHKTGLEEAARCLRYCCYEKAADEIRNMAEENVKVALAHHADDNAETVLFQMIRGSGIDGLCGMQPKRKLKNGVELIRPLLGITRVEIEQYLQEEGQSYCFDSTNADTAYSRNRIRESVLPILKEVNAQAVTHINQSAAFLREVSDYLQKQVALQAKQILLETDRGICIQEEPLFLLSPVIRKELLHLALTRAAGAAKDLSAEHIRLLDELFSLQVGRSISLPYQVVAKRVYEGVLLNRGEKGEAAEPFFKEIEEEKLQELLAAGECQLEVPGGRLSFSLLKQETPDRKILKKTYTKYLDYGKMKGSLQIRTRRSGDYLVIDDAGHKKSLKEYFINEKIPAEKRDKMLLLAIEEKVLWVIGGRISADVKISNRTEHILKVQIKGGNYHEN